ncbi:hypothetical protein JCM9140_752 [Halalkalibacter wakoensis JCM 9140]|uniref:PilZ domain-containing protein n=1 Tax=Halalkalibacter wakoensis JCM 9140 TaxID=1236970 RepID=W4PYN0_9BACI|nr:PilZ domain-containing protein [Halalkalibacter wakoensis]GAE24800.1 hypothetical protein JCM9140_752 [Halalkalibacter wakoensis JCM 9140]
MPYRRNEAFRFPFSSPIQATFKLIKLAEKEITSSEGEIQLLDISPGGLRGKSSLSLPDPENTKTSLEIQFQLNSEKLVVQGEIVWKKALAYSYEYGVVFSLTDAEEALLVNELKKYTKKQT